MIAGLALGPGEEGRGSMGEGRGGERWWGTGATDTEADITDEEGYHV